MSNVPAIKFVNIKGIRCGVRADDDGSSYESMKREIESKSEFELSIMRMASGAIGDEVE